MMPHVRNIVFLALLTAAMTVLGYFESLIPLPFAIPGIKLGIANIFVIAILVFFRFREALLAVLVRQVLSLMITGNALSFLLSLAGGLVSFLTMFGLLKLTKNRFSLIGISIAGSVSHVAAQMAMAAVLTKNTYVFYYTPALLISSLFAGVFVGLCSSFFIRLIQKHR